MPPRHLLLPTTPEPNSQIDIVDLAGASKEILFSTLAESEPRLTWLVAPTYFAPHSGKRDLFLGPYRWHVDTDHLAELWQGGWKNGGIGVWAFGQSQWSMRQCMSILGTSRSYWEKVNSMSRMHKSPKTSKTDLSLLRFPACFKNWEKQVESNSKPKEG